MPFHCRHYKLEFLLCQLELRGWFFVLNKGESLNEDAYVTKHRQAKTNKEDGQREVIEVKTKMTNSEQKHRAGNKNREAYFKALPALMNVLK